NEHRHVLAPVMHGDRVAEHGRHDHGPAGTGPDHILCALFVLGDHLLYQGGVHEGSLLQAARHADLLLALLAGLATTDDELVARLLGLAGATFRLPPRAAGGAATARLAFTTPERVVDRVHGDTAHGRTLALPTQPAGLAPADVGLLGVADLTDGRAAAHIHVADLAGRHPQLSVRTLLGDQLDARAGRPRRLF